MLNRSSKSGRHVNGGNTPIFLVGGDSLRKANKNPEPPAE
jgi:hypothetical protein